MAKSFLASEIAASIVPISGRWPAVDTGAWGVLRDGVEQLRALIGALEFDCKQIEQNQDLNADAIVRKRNDLGIRAMAQLDGWAPLSAAITAVEKAVAALNKQMRALPDAPANIHEALLAQDMRDFIRRQEHPGVYVMDHLMDPGVLACVLHSPPLLLGMSDESWNAIRERARSAWYPDEIKQQAALEKALADLTEGVEAAKRMILRRCDLRVDADLAGGRKVVPIRAAAPPIAVA